MWRKYFKFIKLVPGKVVVPGHGTIDFSKDNLPVDLCKKLFENGFPYLGLTEEGKEKFLGIKPNTNPTRKSKAKK